MRERWSLNCVGFLVLVVLAPTATAARDDEYQIHQLEKNHNLLRHPKREASCQQPGYSLCPASVNGGCCPDNYACAVSYCYATTAGPTSACGSDGYYNCPLTAGAGSCCPVGYICQRDTCLPPAGATSTETCDASAFGCPASLGGGCCPSGMVCGSRTCYATTPETFLVSATVTTTNSRGSTITTIATSTVVTTEGPDPSLSSATAVGVPKLVASTVSKLPSVETGSSDSGGGGLTQSQLGGIIGGAVALLIIIIAIAGIIIWRLKRTEKAAKAAAESKHEGSSDQPRSNKLSFGQPTISEIDGSTDVDSVARARNAHTRARSDSSTIGDRSPSRTPNLYRSNASTPPTLPGYFALPLRSDASDGRQSSLDSYGATRHDSTTPIPPRVSTDSQGTRGHTRQDSNLSELDGSIVSAHGVSELESPDATEAARRRSSSATRTPRPQVRRTSDPTGSSRGARGDGAAAGMPLGTLNEVNELHGHYGPPEIAVGQTAARLDTKDSSISSSLDT
ncbi:hypothetical protein F4677DRAFT_155497 [Hypoxylon crocopeplum]|nr:hypothetical protein F4677DRAFT_155497 [Hypoxylon crocopeplum]